MSEPTNNGESIPKCIGIIMDGNRRWAKKQGLLGFLGHTEGYKKFKEFIGWAKEHRVKHIIAYAFSTENWKRSEEEIKHLTELLRNILNSEVETLRKEGVRLKFIGEIDKFPSDIAEKIKNVETESTKFSEIEVTIALSYGGRSEIISAIKKIPGNTIAELTEKTFGEFLFTKDTPDPDLIIRTGGEVRLSNFLLWQAAYSELFFSKTLWPDFTKEEFNTILKDFSSRERRVGK